MRLRFNASGSLRSFNNVGCTLGSRLSSRAKRDHKSLSGSLRSLLTFLSSIDTRLSYGTVWANRNL